MQRREVIKGLGVAGLTSALPAVAARSQTIERKGRIKQGLWRSAFGTGTGLSFGEMCREAARLGAHGFDRIDPKDWPTLRKHGLDPLLAGPDGVDFKNGIIHAEVHDNIEASLKNHIDLCADNDVKTVITIGGQRRGMRFSEAADNAVAFLKKLRPQLEANGVTLAIENMNNKLKDPHYGRADQVFGHWDWGVGVCERVNSANVKLVCDIYHLQVMDGDLARHIRESIQWIAHFHVAGVPTRNEINSTQEINYQYLAEVIAELDYDGYVSHEWRPSAGRDPLEAIAESMDILDV